MLLAEVHQLIDHVATIDAPTASLSEATAGLASVTRLRGWLEARSLAMIARVAELSTFPENDVGCATRSSQRTAAKALRRSETARAVPMLAAALASGSVTPEHVDAVSKGLASLEPSAREAFTARLSGLIPIAESTTADQFERVIRREADAHRQADGEERLARQRAAARFRCWFDRETGMWRVNGEFDPETGLRLHDRIAAMMRSKFAEHTPDGCPTDPGEKQDWLRAQAVAALLDGENVTGRSGVPETVIVVDTRSGTIDWGFDVTLPASALQRFMDRSNIHIVDIDGTIVVSAPGELNLGRTSRLATRAQRRVLRVLYATCGIPGCCVKYENTKPHHVLWWRHGGTTDLDNLLPLCHRHHARVHDGTLTLHLAPDRTLTVTLQDGQTMTTGPPDTNDA